MANFKVLVLNGMTNVVDSDLNGLAISFLNSTGGIVGSGDFLVAAQSTPNNTVQVASGRAWLPNVNIPPTNMYGVYADSSQNVTIAPNTSGNPRIDSIVLYLNLTATPTATGNNIPQLADVQGTPAGSPVAPTSTQITNAIGAGNPYLILANITVANGFSSINSGNITDERFFTYFTTGQVVPIPQYEEFTDQASAPAAPTSGKTRLFTIGSNLFLKQPTGPIIQIGSSSLVNNGNSGTTPSVDWTQGITQAFTLNNNVTFTFANPVAGEKLVLILTQDSAGSRTATWPANVKWPNGIAPTLSTTAGKIDIIGFMWNGSNYLGVSSLTY